DAELHLKRYADARAHAERALALREKAFGPATTKLLDSLLVLGRVELAAGRPARAVTALERGFKLLAPDTDSGVRARMQFELARALIAVGGGDRLRAVHLAGEARELMAADPALQRELPDVDRWLASNGGR